MTFGTVVPVVGILAGMGFPPVIPFPLFIGAGLAAAGAWWAGAAIARHPILMHVQVAFSSALTGVITRDRVAKARPRPIA